MFDTHRSLRNSFRWGRVRFDSRGFKMNVTSQIGKLPPRGPFLRYIRIKVDRGGGESL